MDDKQITRMLLSKGLDQVHFSLQVKEKKKKNKISGSPGTAMKMPYMRCDQPVKKGFLCGEETHTERHTEKDICKAARQSTAGDSASTPVFH